MDDLPVSVKNSVITALEDSIKIIWIDNVEVDVNLINVDNEGNTEEEVRRTN